MKQQHATYDIEDLVGIPLETLADQLVATRVFLFSEGLGMVIASELVEGVSTELLLRVSFGRDRPTHEIRLSAYSAPQNYQVLIPRNLPLEKEIGKNKQKRSLSRIQSAERIREKSASISQVRTQERKPLESILSPYLDDPTVQLACAELYAHLERDRDSSTLVAQMQTSLDMLGPLSRSDFRRRSSLVSMLRRNGIQILSIPIAFSRIDEDSDLSIEGRAACVTSGAAALLDLGEWESSHSWVRRVQDFPDLDDEPLAHAGRVLIRILTHHPEYARSLTELSEIKARYGRSDLNDSIPSRPIIIPSKSLLRRFTV